MKSLRLLGFLVVLLLVTVVSCAGHGDGQQPYRVVRPTIAFEMLHDDPELLVIDLRTRREFRGPKGHLNNAENIPLDALDEVLPGLGRFKESTILVYCRRGPCGAEGARILRSHGFQFVNLMEGGIEAWTEAGFGTTHEDVPVDEDDDEETFHYDLDEEPAETEDPTDPVTDEDDVDDDRPNRIHSGRDA